jgi:hypothetical protein
MWIKINHELVNTDDIKSVKDGGARVLEYETGTTRYFKGSANGIVVTMKDGTRYTSIDGSANRNRRELRRANILS